ncbi:MAG: hypothetical protein HRU34_08355 [Richelia sp.]|nr:hypothetical protein [Richelia sp.]
MNYVLIVKCERLRFGRVLEGHQDLEYPPNKHSYPHLALPYAIQSSPVAGTLVGQKNGHLSIKELK